MNKSKGIVYLIHFKIPYKGVQHYIGFCEYGNMEKRLENHKNGNGARLLSAINDAGIEYEIHRIWMGADRNFERELKRQKNTKRLCPVCNPGNCWNHKSQTKGEIK